MFFVLSLRKVRGPVVGLKVKTQHGDWLPDLFSFWVYEYMLNKYTGIYLIVVAVAVVVFKDHSVMV